MRKIRVLQFPFSQNNGVTAYATNNWKYLDKERFICDFAVVRKSFSSSWESCLIHSGAGIKKIFSSAEKDRERYIEQVRTMLYGNYDVVHLHTSFWKRLLIEQLAIECKIPKVIVHSHSSGFDLNADDAVRRDAEALHYRLREQFTPDLATDFCACSWAAADWLFGEQIPHDKIRIMKNAIEVEKFLYNKAVRDKYRVAMGLDRSFVIGHVGRFSYQKNHRFLLETFCSAVEKIPNARLMLVGEGPLTDDMRVLASELKIDEKVLFLGQRNDIPQLMQAMDVFCLPSRFEGLPIVLVEAQTAGLKCLTSTAVTGEVCISANLTRIPLNVEDWVQALLTFSKGYERENMFDIITAEGYNIKFQIKKVERLYAN